MPLDLDLLPPGGKLLDGEHRLQPLQPLHRVLVPFLGGRAHHLYIVVGGGLIGLRLWLDGQDVETVGQFVERPVPFFVGRRVVIDDERHIFGLALFEMKAEPHARQRATRALRSHHAAQRV